MPARRPLQFSFKGATPEQSALVARKEPARTERQQESEKADAEPSEEGKGDEVPKPDNAPPAKGKAEDSTKPDGSQNETTEEKTPATKKSRKKAARNTSQGRGGRKKRLEAPASDPLVTQTFRLPQSLSERLQITSMERKVKKLYPASQQDIVAEALFDWFEKLEGDE